MRLIFTRRPRSWPGRLLAARQLARNLWPAPARRRLRDRLGVHLRRHGWAWLLLLAIALWFQARFSIGINLSSSLPERLYLIDREARPARGDLVAFLWEGDTRLPSGTVLIKILAGLPGDAVDRQDRAFSVNGQPMGEARTQDRHGKLLAPGPSGRLPEQRFYVHAPHPESLDSRYDPPGWVRETQVLGRAHALF